MIEWLRKRDFAAYASRHARARRVWRRRLDAIFPLRAPGRPKRSRIGARRFQPRRRAIACYVATNEVTKWAANAGLFRSLVGASMVSRHAVYAAKILKWLLGFIVMIMLVAILSYHFRYDNNIEPLFRGAFFASAWLVN